MFCWECQKSRSEQADSFFVCIGKKHVSSKNIQKYKRASNIVLYVGWLISKVSYRVLSLIVGGKKHLYLRSVIDTA
jgi:hypothetical protein